MRVTAVLVAYNRRELLRESLEAIAAQSRPVDRIVVVDNASDDGSGDVAAEMLEAWEGRGRLIRLTENTGGAGGFAVGIAAAEVEESTDWIWVMDDDTVPGPDALAGALDAHQRYLESGQDDLAVMGSRVVWTDGEDHPMNTPKPKIGASQWERDRAAKAGCMEIRSISFVSAFLRASRVRELGLPIADYFLWNDDFEFSARMLRGARGLFVPASVVAHKTAKRGSSDQDPGPRFYYEVRNKLWVFRLSPALRGWEKALYIGATARRWLRTLRASSDRGQLLGCLRRGWRDGWRTAPRPDRDVLRNAGVPVDVKIEIDRLTRASNR
ncbi:glycosyltransferase family 2 protein [Leucobacter sp. CSA2]|uniref:Glycosyltransferase family 2 protein n=1 Tax=Leucobacter edaphi TaxID=2796472 RepID=A0A934QE81_9MICO|nr:glycosyltransferase family 2 protein [Leucobacter edaphi]MBK0421647.1 glycosyltransferase family 2 protein [Leucobacter edaphi]